jgi:hypothetical protein
MPPNNTLNITTIISSKERMLRSIVLTESMDSTQVIPVGGSFRHIGMESVNIDHPRMFWDQAGPSRLCNLLRKITLVDILDDTSEHTTMMYPPLLNAAMDCVTTRRGRQDGGSDSR